MEKIVNYCDTLIIKTSRRFSIPFARIALFIVFFWFGLLKVIGKSPANPLVESLFDITIPFLEFSHFIVIFGLFEMVIGLSFLFPNLIRFSIATLLLHLITTILPLILLKEVTWSHTFVPTLEGQYIIKNILIIAVALAIIGRMHIEKKC